MESATVKDQSRRLGRGTRPNTLRYGTSYDCTGRGYASRVSG
jgi:hypothetical protein